jgi:hypothetical protein
MKSTGHQHGYCTVSCWVADLIDRKETGLLVIAQRIQNFVGGILDPRSRIRKICWK